MNTDREVITGLNEIGTYYGHIQGAGATSINVLLIDGFPRPNDDYGYVVYYLYGGSLTTEAELNYIEIGASANRNGLFRLGNTGMLQTSEFNVGYSGDGIFNQDGGSANFTGNSGGFRLAVQPGSSGIARISGGTLITDACHIGGSVVGNGGTGILNISGGRTTVTGTMKIHNNLGTKVTLSGGVLAPGAIDLSGNTNLFDWTGGAIALPTLTVSNSGFFATNLLTPNPSITGNRKLFIGTGVVASGAEGGNVVVGGNSGSLTLNTGTLAVGHVTYVGTNGSGTFTQNGGTHSLGRALIVGDASGEPGTYNLNNGIVTTNAGVNYVSVGDDAGSNGTFNFNNGTLNTVSLDVGYRGTGKYDQFNGAADFRGANYGLRIAVFPGSNGMARVLGGTLNTDALVVGGHFDQPGGTGKLVVQEGNVIVDGTLKVWNNGRVEFNSGQLLTDEIDLRGGGRIVLSAGGTKALRNENFLSIDMAAGSRIDLADRMMVTDVFGFDQITLRSLIVAGRNGGNWAGPGITSSAAATHGNAAIGFAYSTDLFTTFPATWLGQTGIDASSYLITYTLKGDTNLDRSVNFSDLLRVAQNYNLSGKWWNEGDFTYDSNVNFVDLLALAQNYNGTLSASELTQLGNNEFASDWTLAMSMVPEPTLATGLLAMLALAGRPKRRATQSASDGR